MSAPIVKKNNKEVSINGDDNVKGIIESVFGDVSKSSATKQLVIGGASGWATGFITMRVGKIAAFAIGGGIILLQVANHQGYIKVNWDKLYKHLDKVADKVEEKATGEGPKWMEKVERYVDRKVDKAEDALKRKERKARRWYHNFIGDEQPRLQDLHIFLAAFAGGVALGLVTSA